MELCRRSGAQHGRRRALHSAGEHRCHHGRRSPGTRQVQGAALHAAARRAGPPGIRATPGGLHAGPQPMNDTAAQTPAGAPPPEPSSTVDASNPWLGLVSFTEETRAYFFGRDEEVAELARRVQRKLLTLLFGQSGLGKTSMLRAGLVPRLRALGYCPVYVRIDYSPESPSPSEQIKAAIFRATQASGQWTQAGAAVEGESLWEF